MNILVVEDNEDSRVLLCYLLENKGYEVKSASNGREALELVWGSAPDLIITDILMPEMDGYDFCYTVKNTPDLAHIPIIFYTATYITKKDQELGLLMGASRFIIKPQEPSVFLDLIGEIIKEKLPSPQIPDHLHDDIKRMHWEALENKLHKKVKDLETERIEKNELENKLVQLASEFHGINQTLSYITEATSHDLLEPLRKISSFSGRLNENLKNNLDERQQVYLKVIERSSRKMKTNIEDLGELTRVSNADIVFEEVDLGDVMESVLENLSLDIIKSMAQFEIESLSTLVSDKKHLIELFGGIVSNCLNFKRENEALEIQIKSQEAEDGYVIISVKDTGIGFDNKYADRIFVPFQQLSRVGTDEGSGMGLAICKKIVTRLGGEISATSSPAKGATITVKLPINKI
jgi:signal transduction histidine kinase